MGILDDIGEAIRGLRDDAPLQTFHPKPPSPEHSTSGPYAVDAYGTGDDSGTTEKAYSDWERHLRDKETARKEAESTQAHRFDNDTTVEVFHKGGSSITFVTSGNKSYCTTARSDEYFDVSFRSDGATVRTDKQSGTKMTSHLTEKGFYYDNSSFTPAFDKRINISADSGGHLNLCFGADGRVRIESMEGNVAANSAFIKCKDGGIRTNDRNGNLVLADPKALPRDMSRADKKAHAAFVEQAKQNPELVAMQGVSPPVSSPSPAFGKMQEAPPMQGMPQVTTQSVIAALQDPNSSLRQATAQLGTALGENKPPQPAQDATASPPQHMTSTSPRRPSVPDARQQPANSIRGK